MRILLVNPNTSEALTANMARIARGVAPAGTEIVPLTAPRGFPYIASQVEAQISATIAYEMIADQAAGADGAIIAAFGDPGLAGAKQLFDFPVVGMAEAAIASSALLGERFSIVTFSPVMRRWYTDSVRDAGLLSRFTGVRTPPAHTADFHGMQERLRPALVDLCNAAIAEDGADVVILGGAPLAGMSAAVEADVDGLVVDPISAATLQVLALAGLVGKPGFARRGHKPLSKTSIGLALALASRLRREP